MIWCFNFKAQFAGRVERGSKTQTVRALRKDGRVPVIGDTVKLYEGLRTKATRLLRPETQIVLVEDILITICGVFIDGEQLSEAEVFEFAQRDGFESSVEFYAWFTPTIHSSFKGFVVYWRAP